jgi:phosphoribosyl 1,2-cyclic phosphodiesterase
VCPAQWRGGRRGTTRGAALASKNPVTGISVRFWGVRGSVPCPGPETVRYGGNTACVEVRCDDRLVIFDAGTGLRALGHALAAGPPGLAADIFISHCHIDHIAGLPFFEPCYMPASQIRIWAGNLLPEQRLADVARILMSAPLFPSGEGVFKAKIKFCDFQAGDVLNPYPGVTLRTAPPTPGARPVTGWSTAAVRSLM